MANSPKSTKKILSIRDVTKVYKLGKTEINALSGVSLDIYEGDFIVIFGKSGSGKSTLMHMIGLLDTPTTGTVMLNGRETSKLDDRELAKTRNKEIGFVFQSFNLLRRTSALDNVILPLKYSETPKKLWRKKAEDTLKLVELGDRMKNKSNELSGGERQRVAIARALVTKPSIVLADEPTGNLDTKTGDEIIKLFETLHEQGRTVIIVTHDEDFAKIAEKKIVLSDGKIIEQK